MSPLLYNEYTDDLNHHLQVTGVWCYVGGAWLNSLSYADDMVLLAPTATALQTLFEVCRAQGVVVRMLDLKTLYTTRRKPYVYWSDQSNHTAGTQQLRVRHGNEELSFVGEFRYLRHVMTADCRDDTEIKKIIQEVKFSWQYAPICTY